MSVSRRRMFGLAGAAVAVGAAHAFPATRGVRLSTIETDPGYAPWLEFLGTRGKPLVYLDGVEVALVETADEEMGFIIRVVAEDDGGIKVVDDEIVRETLRGTVRIVAGG